jgi:2-amino-4-hydroxy-6-hydroxymethyldihydropteridine diphosphokinase
MHDGQTCIVHLVSGIVVQMPTIAYIGLGSNRGDRKTNCRKALELLAESGRVTKVSSFYRTEPVGFKDQEDFINAVAEVETDLSPQELLAACNRIEAELGRTREVRWGPRTIDLDILLYGDRTVHDHDPDLTIPHPLLADRRFVLVPLCEIAPQALHPVSGKTVERLLHELENSHSVVKCDP